MTAPSHIGSYFEIWLTRLGFLIIPHLSRKAVVRLASLLGWVTPRISRKLNRIGTANIDLAFGDKKTAKEKRHILIHSCRTFALVLLDAFWFSRQTTQRIAQLVSFDPSFSVMFKDCPHVAISAHYGNWEILGMGITHQGYPLHSVAKPLKNPRVDELFDEVRVRNGQQIIKRKGAVRSLLRILQQGGKIGLIMDQNTKLTEGGQFFNFFGLPASFATAGAALALKTGCNVIVCFMLPLPDGTYRGSYCREIQIGPYLDMDNAAAVTALTAEVVSEMEHYIREQPDYWLWTYKRWKYVPEGDDPSRFPFYRRNAE